ncbi:hypothetical protein BGX20_009554, partial [Mortierella sp. AD010]
VMIRVKATIGLQDLQTEEDEAEDIMDPKPIHRMLDLKSLQQPNLHRSQRLQRMSPLQLQPPRPSPKQGPTTRVRVTITLIMGANDVAVVEEMHVEVEEPTSRLMEDPDPLLTQHQH